MKIGIAGLEEALQKSAYADYRRRLDARALLDHYNAQNRHEQINHKGETEIIHSCLLDRVEPHHANADASPSAACNIDTKTYVCYALGFGCDLFHLVMKLEGKEGLSESLSVIGQFLAGATTDSVAFQNELEAAFATPQAYHFSLPSYSPQMIQSWVEHPHPYWLSRGVTLKAQAVLQLGYDPTERRVVFPHFVYDTLVGWQKRVVPGETVPDHPKYRNTSGFPKSETLYNLNSALAHPRVLVVESPMSVARAVSLGIPNVVATFGAKVSPIQIELLSSFERVYVWFDRDPAGMAGEKKLVEGLYRHTNVQVVTPDSGRDLGDADLSEVADKLDHATPAALRLGQYDSYKLERMIHGR